MLTPKMGVMGLDWLGYCGGLGIVVPYAPQIPLQATKLLYVVKGLFWRGHGSLGLVIEHSLERRLA